MLALSFTLALVARPAPFAPDSVATGAHFRIEAHFAGDAVANDALATAEATWPLVTALYGPIQLGTDERLVVHLYRTAADYERAEDALTHGRFKTNLSLTSHETREAHVALQPDVHDGALARIGLTMLTRECVAHEAVHVASAHAWPNWNTLPDWFSEGAAMWITQETMVQGGWAPKTLDDPTLSTDARRVQRLHEAKQLPRLADIVDGKLGELTGPQRYALWSHVFRFLHDGKTSAAFTKLAGVARATGGGAQHGEKVARAARELLGGDAGLAALDTEFASCVKALAPRWEEIHRSLSTRGDAWAQTAFPQSNAIAWRTDDAGGERYQLSGEFELLPGANQQLNVLLGRTDSGFVQVAFNAGNGVTVFEFDNRREGDAAWKRLGFLEASAVRAGARVKFLVRVDKSKLTITVDDAKAGDVDLAGHPMKGAWGLGALAGSAGLWTKIQFKRG